MKIYIYLIIVMLIIIVFAILSGFWMKDGVSAVETSLKQIETEIAKRDWKKAQKAASEAYTIWEAKSDNWPVLIDYTEVSHIENAFAELIFAVKEQESYEAGKAMVTIRYWLSYILERDKINADNIL